MRHHDANLEDDGLEPREDAVGDLDVRDAEDVLGGSGRRDDGPEESITFVYGRL
jgi:hypothetical protein